MKKPLTFILLAFLFGHNLTGQSYVPFPTDSAVWNCLLWSQWSPNDIFLVNSSYIMKGDTNINGISYNKIYYMETDNPSYVCEYIGGLREDSAKNIYFFPGDKNLAKPEIIFPGDTSEYLLYTFNNLDSGMVLPIDTGFTKITVLGTDSVLLGENYRKRYKIQQEGLFFYDYWIEGIGSIKDLLIPFTYEFEWQFYTLCFTDTVTYYINSPNGKDSCHYQLPAGVNETKMSNAGIYPNPASKTLFIKTGTENQHGYVNIYNSKGQLVIRKRLVKPELKINIEGIKPGLYVVEIIYPHRKQYLKFVKE